MSVKFESSMFLGALCRTPDPMRTTTTKNDERGDKLSDLAFLSSLQKFFPSYPSEKKTSPGRTILTLKSRLLLLSNESRPNKF